jgi:hypothetical protein
LPLTSFFVSVKMFDLRCFLSHIHHRLFFASKPLKELHSPDLARKY